MKQMIDASKLPKTQTQFTLSRNTYLGTLQEECPKAVELLAEYGLHCMSCIFSAEDTLETGAQKHGYTGEDIDTIIEEVNGELSKNNQIIQISK